MARTFLVIGSVMMVLAVACGAFAAHGLKSRLAPELLALWQTGVEYHFYHALGLLVVGLLAVRMPQSGLLQLSGWAMANGIALFSGSLYALAFGAAKSLGAVTPIGGMLFIAGWVLLAACVLRSD